MRNLNRLNVAHNHYQGWYKRVLCCCSAGVLRAPTAAFVLSQEPFNFNTRPCGIDVEFALVPIDDVLVDWADEIVVMEPWMKDHIEGSLELGYEQPKPIIVLNVPDRYPYRDPALIALITDHYLAATKVPASE